MLPKIQDRYSKDFPINYLETLGVFWKSGYSSDNLYCQQIEKDPPKLNLTQSCIDLRLIVLSKVTDVSDSETQSKVQLYLTKLFFCPEISINPIFGMQNFIDNIVQSDSSDLGNIKTDLKVKRNQHISDYSLKLPFTYFRKR